MLVRRLRTPAPPSDSHTLLGLLLFAASLGPGYVYLRVAELREPRQERSQLVEAAELVFAGVVASTIGSLVIVAIAEATETVDVDELALDPASYERLAPQDLRPVGYEETAGKGCHQRSDVRRPPEETPRSSSAAHLAEVSQLTG